MNTQFEVKTKQNKVLENGKEKLCTEYYIVESDSFGGAEKKVVNTFKGTAPITILQMKYSPYDDALLGGGANYYKVKMITEVIDGELRAKTSSNVLVTADEIESVNDIIKTRYSDSIFSFDIISISNSNIVDVLI